MRIIKVHESKISNIISMSICKSDQVAVFGMNGSGKTMLLDKISNSRKKMISNRDINTAAWKKIVSYSYQIGMERHINKNISDMSSGQRKKIYFMQLITMKKRI
jgi:ABC-type Mn2+/Zn2+ transport system ATPase subunit